MLPHCASVVQGVHVFVAWLQMGVEPLHWLSEMHAKHAPETSHQGCAALFVLHCVLFEHAKHAWLVVSQIGLVPVHCESAVHWLVRSKLAVVGAFGVVDATV